MPYAFPRGLNECVARVVLRGRGKRRGEEEVHARDIWEEHRGRKLTNKDAQCSGLERLPCFFPVENAENLRVASFRAQFGVTCLLVAPLSSCLLKQTPNGDS